jgi:hypothetical protein
MKIAPYIYSTRPSANAAAAARPAEPRTEPATAALVLEAAGDAAEDAVALGLALGVADPDAFAGLRPIAICANAAWDVFVVVFGMVPALGLTEKTMPDSQWLALPGVGLSCACAGCQHTTVMRTRARGARRRTRRPSTRSRSSC